MLYDLTIFINCVGYRLEWLFMFTLLLFYFLQDGMLKYKGTYEIISPDDIGLTCANEFGIVLGKLRYYATYHPHLTSFSPIFCCDVSQLDFSYQLSTLYFCLILVCIGSVTKVLVVG